MQRGREALDGVLAGMFTVPGRRPAQLGAVMQGSRWNQLFRLIIGEASRTRGKPIRGVQRAGTGLLQQEAAAAGAWESDAMRRSSRARLDAAVAYWK